MKSKSFRTAVLIFALLALCAAFIALCATPASPGKGAVERSGSHSAAPSPSATPVKTVPPEASATARFGTADLPLSGYIIGIDPGHQATPNPEKEPVSPGSSLLKESVSEGAYGSFTLLPEYELNLSVALKLKNNLKSLGASVIMTRETNDVDIPNSHRAKMMNESGVDCWLRIHANNSAEPKVHGMFMLAPAKGCLNTSDPAVYDESVRLANALLGSALSSTGANSRGVNKRDDQTGFNWSSVPVCTIEMGFMTNEAEDRLLASDDYQEQIAQGLAEGFVNFFKY